MNDRLRERARDAIVTGRVPSRPAARSWAGKGSGAACSICLCPVTADDVELELEFGDGLAPESQPCCRVHAPCFAAWQRECSDG